MEKLSQKRFIILSFLEGVEEGTGVLVNVCVFK